MKVSIITAVFNNVLTLESSIRSVRDQDYENIEHIIIDGGSTDGSINVIERYKDNIARWISEPDDGIYDALNKGMAMSTGEIIGFLHADDLYADKRVVEMVVNNISEHHSDSCYGDLEYVSRNNSQKIIRYWKACPYKEGLFQKGWMPPHPSFFVKKSIYDKYGSFNTDFRIAADYELILRLIGKCKISTHYIPEVLVRMRTGGASNKSIKNLMLKSVEDYKALKLNNMNNAIRTVFLKNISKFPQFFQR